MPIILVLPQELEERIEQYRADPEKNFSDQEAEYLDAMVNGDMWELNQENLETLQSMIENLPFNYQGKDTLLAKIQDKIKKAQENTALNDQENENIDEYTEENVSAPLDNDEYRLNQPQWNVSDYENIPPYELLKEYERLSQNGDDDSIARCDAIRQIAEQELNGAPITSNSAPLLDTYYKIMRLGDPDYPVPQEELDDALAQYDQDHGLNQFNMTAEEWRQNYEEWNNKITRETVSNQLSVNEPFSSVELGLYDECVETLRDKILTEISYTADQIEDIEDYVGQQASAYSNQINQQLSDFALASFTNLSNSNPNAAATLVKGFAQNIEKDPQEIMNNLESYQEAFAQYLLHENPALLQSPEGQEQLRHIVNQVNANYNTETNILQTRLAMKTNAPALMKEHTNWYKKLKEKHPKSVEFAKNLALSGIAASFGPTGLMALSAYKLGETYSEFKKQYKEQNPDKPAKMKAILKWIMHDKDRKNKFLTRAALTGVSVIAGASLVDTAIRPFASLAITASSSLHTYVNKNIGIKAQKQELAELLHKYNDEFFPFKHGDDKKRFETLLKSLDGEPSKFSKLFLRKKTPMAFESALQDITPNTDITAEDREKIMALVKDIKAKKSQRKAAVLGVTAGALSVLGLKWFNAEHGNSEIPSGEAHAATPETTNDVSVPAAPDEPTTEAPAPIEEPVIEDPSTHLFEGQENNPNLDFAVNATPTPTYQKLMEIGVLDEEKAKELMDGRSYIPSRVLRDYLQNDAQFTPDQQQEFNDFINDRDARMAEFNADRAAHAARAAAHHGTASAVPHDAATPVQSNTPISDQSETNTDPVTTPHSSAQQSNIEQQVEEAKNRVYHMTLKNGTKADVSGPNALSAFGKYSQEHGLDPSQGKVQATLVSDENHSVTDITAKNQKMTIKTYHDQNNDGVGQRSERLHTTTIKNDGNVQEVRIRGDLDGNGHRGDVHRTVTDGAVTSDYNYTKGAGRTLTISASDGSRVVYEKVNGQTMVTQYDSQGNASASMPVQGNPGIKTLRQFWQKQIREH